MRYSNSARVGCACMVLSLVLASAVAGCGDEPFPWDISQSDNGEADSVDVEDADAVDLDGPGPVTDYSGDVKAAVQTLRIKSPKPGKGELVTGKYTVVFVYTDEADLPATVTVDMTSEYNRINPVSVQVPGSGEYSIEIDALDLLYPADAYDCNETLVVTAVSQDGRTISATSGILLDIKPPVIGVYATYSPSDLEMFASPDKPQRFIEDLPLRVIVSDAGTQVRSVRVSIENYEWTWPPEEGMSSEIVDTRTKSSFDDTYTDLSVPTDGWPGGYFVLKIEASDGVEGHDSILEFPLTMVEVPQMYGGDSIEMVQSTSMTGDDLVPCTDVEGIRLGPAANHDWALLARVAASDSNPNVGTAGLFKPDGQGRADSVDVVLTDSPTLMRVADANRDGYDDIVAVTTGVSSGIVVLFQNADGSFSRKAFVEYKDGVPDLATGDLNGDGYLDMAFVNTQALQNLGVVLSQVDGNGDLTGWGAPTLYSGAVSPDHVEIGLFCDNGRNAIALAAKGSGQVTVFPVSEDGIPAMGENSTLDPENPLLDDVSGMVAVNFGSQGSLPDSLVFADSTGSPLFGVARLRLDGSRRIESVVDWPTGQGPGKMVTGDIDGNGVADIVVLCGASNMVQVFMGKPGPVDFEYVDQGVSLLAGAAMDVTLADMDDDGFLDLVLARESGQVVVIFYRQYAGGSMFLGSYQGILGDWPVSLATGHFLAPLPGAGADYLDAALLVEPGAGAAGVAVFASDHMVGMPFRSVGTVGIGVGNAKQILAGNFDVDRNVGLTDPATRPDDLIVATSAIATQANPYTAKAVLFNEVDHSTPAATVKGIKAGDVPAIAVVDDFDLDEGGAHDVAFIWHLVKTLAKDSFWYLQPHLGAMDGTFAAQDPGGVSIDPLQIQDNRNPVKAVSFPMRRTLLDYVNGVAAPPDILVANRGTNDFTVFVGMGDGSFMPKYDGSLDFAAGGIPVDIKAGYLRGSVLETVETDPEAEQLPDVVVLLNGYLMISYSLDAPALQESGEDVGFRAPVAIGMPSAKQPIALELADMDGDGFMDIVVLDQRLSKVFVYMNLAERMFAGPYGYSTGKTPVSMSVADVDADGCLDIVTADRDGRTVTTIHNDTPTCRSGQQRRR